MSRFVKVGVRTFAAASVATILSLAPSQVAAQTTLVLDAPDSEVTDSYIRGGSNAGAVYNTTSLATKANSNLSNVRRSLLKFDTETRIPKGASIQSARLTLTLKKSDPQTRTIGVYRITQSFQESQANWTTRKSGYRWTSAGGDFSSRLASFSMGSSVGTKVTVDVTSLVRSTVAGSYGSRYTRIALVDAGSSSDTSYKEFYSSESSETTKRPTLTVVYGGGSSTPSTPSTPSGSSTRLKVLEWNTHYGVGTDGKYDLNRIATKIASFNPDIIALTEVTRRSHYSATDDGPARYLSLLKAKTGRNWYQYYRTDNGALTGVGNLVLSRFPIASTSYCQLSGRRVAVQVAVHVNGRLLNFWSTHLDSASGNSLRLTEVSRLRSCMGSFAQQRVVAGDFNAQSSASEIGRMKADYYDAWAEAASDGTATDYPGNSRAGATRNTRIDYIFFSHGASYLRLRGTQVFDTRSSGGVMPSDHKPVMATFDVR